MLLIPILITLRKISTQSQVRSSIFLCNLITTNQRGTMKKGGN